MNNRMKNEKQINANSCDPHKITIVGLDTNDGPEHPLFDGPANVEPVNEGLVKVMLQEGFVGTVTVRKTKGAGGEDVFEAVDGRQRIKAAREAWKRCKDDVQRELLKVKFVYEDGDARSLLTMVGMLNEHRRTTNDMDRAAYAARLRAAGKTLAECGVILDDVSGQWVSQLLKLNNLAPELQEKVRTGELPTAAALEIVETGGIDDQRATLKAAVAAKKEAAKTAPKPKSGGKLKPAKRRARVQAKDVKSAKGKAPSRGKRAIAKLMHEHEASLSEEFCRGVRWALGELTDKDVGIK